MVEVDAVIVSPALAPDQPVIVTRSERVERERGCGRDARHVMYWGALHWPTRP